MVNPATTTLQAFLVTARQGPFVTLYLNHETAFDREKLRLQLRHLLSQARTMLAQVWPEQSWAPFAEVFTRFSQDPKLTMHGGNALVIMTNGVSWYTQPLEYSVDSHAAVTLTPQIVPMLLDLQRHLEFDLLLLSGTGFDLYAVNGRHLEHGKLTADAPRTREAVAASNHVGHEHADGRDGKVVSFAERGRTNQDARDQRRYYQLIDDYVIRTVSKKSGRRLVLFGLNQNISLFRQVSRNPRLSHTMQIALSPSNLTPDDIDTAVDVLRLHNSRTVQTRILTTIDSAKSSGCFVSDLGGILLAAQIGAIACLIIRHGARINGRVLADGQIDTTSIRAQHNDLLTDLAGLTFMQGGKIRMLEADNLTQPVVATLRYPLT